MNISKIIILCLFLTVTSIVICSERPVLVKLNGPVSEISITLFSVKFGASHVQFYTAQNKPARVTGFVGALIAIHVTLIVFGILGTIGFITGIPLLAVGLYNYSYLEEQNDINRNLVISGGVTMGCGLLASISWIFWARIFGVNIADEIYRENQRKKNELPLIAAVKKGQLNKVKELIEKGADINEKNNDNYSAFTAAVISNNYEIAKLLLEQGALIDFNTVEINIEGKNSGLSWRKFNIFECAIENENIDMVRLLAENGGDVSIRVQEGYSVLLTALFCTDNKFMFECINFLISRGLDINIKSAKDNKNVLLHFLTAYWAKEKNAVEKVRFLIEKGIDIKTTDNEGNTALSLARKNGLVEIEKLLIEYEMK